MAAGEMAPRFAAGRGRIEPARRLTVAEPEPEAGRLLERSAPAGRMRIEPPEARSMAGRRLTIAGPGEPKAGRLLGSAGLSRRRHALWQDGA